MEQTLRDKLEIVLRARPSLRPLFESEETVIQYAARILQPHGFDSALRKPMFDFIAKKASRLIPEADVPLVRETLQKASVISSADHHGPLTFPLLINSNILYGLGHTAERKVQLVFSCGGVPLSNVSFPRGIYYKNVKIPLIPSRFENSMVLSLPRFEFTDFRQAVLKSQLSKNDQLALIDFGNEWLSSIESRGESYADQITLLNYSLWQKYFSDATPHRKILYIQMEDIVAWVLSQGDLSRCPLLSGILFDRDMRSECIVKFNGVSGAWNGDKSGTHFFWGVRENGRSYPLRVRGTQLVGAFGEIEISRPAITEALAKGSIYPNVFMLYLTVMFEGGLVLVGGFNQIETLTQMKARLDSLCETFGLSEVARRIASLQAGLVCGPSLVEVKGLERAVESKITPEELSGAGLLSIRDVLMKNIEGIYAVVT